VRRRLAFGAFRGFVRKEARHILRDRQTLGVLIALPLVQVLLFGYVIRTDVENVRIAVVDPAPDHASLALAGRIDGSHLFHYVGTFPEEDALDVLYERAELDVAVVLPPDFGRALGRGEATVQIITDATDPNTGTATASYAEAAVLAFVADFGAGGGGLASPPIRIEPVVRVRFNPTMESRNLFVPGLVALVLTIVSALMTSIAITREKERGTMEVLLVSPLRPWQIIVGKTMPYMVLAFLNALSALAAAWIVFQVPFRGSVTLLLVESLLFITVTLALGVFISTKAVSQRAAMLGALVGTLMPSSLLSGMIFPISSMPAWLQPVTNIIPATWFIEIARGIMLQGVGLNYLWQETLVLFAMAALLTVASVRSFRVRLA
jgi:ABC-2 type transport system permease protein